MAHARQSVPESTVLMGNLNPSDPLFLGTPQAVSDNVRDIIHKTQGRGLIISSGCAMSPATKSENVVALVAAVKEYGTAEQLLELQRNAK
jgi:uroporphyrinogen decarboxylase